LGGPNPKEKRSTAFKDGKIRHRTLKELQDKKYPFFDSDLSGILDYLEKRIIQLLESKRPKDVGRTADPKYCSYHRMVSHILEKCVTLKERIMLLIEDRTIILDLDNVAETNHMSNKRLSLI